MLSSVRLLATKDAKLVSALANGQRVPVFHRHGTRSPDLRSTGSHTARANRRIELPPFRTDVSGRTACSDSAVTGRCHSGCIGARMLGMSRTTHEERDQACLRFRSCLPLFTIWSCAETTNCILPQIATAPDGAARGGAISDEGAALNIQDFVQLLRSRWLTICVTTLVAVLGAVAVTLLTTPLYQASTRLFVSTTVRRIRKRDIPGQSLLPNSAYSRTPSYLWARPWLSALSTNSTSI